jgi:hypothetical protein
MKDVEPRFGLVKQAAPFDNTNEPNSPDEPPNIWKQVITSPPSDSLYTKHVTICKLSSDMPSKILGNPFPSFTLKLGLIITDFGEFEHSERFFFISDGTSACQRRIGICEAGTYTFVDRMDIATCSGRPISQSV